MAKNSGMEPMSSQARTYTDLPSWSVVLIPRLCRLELVELAEDGKSSEELEEPDATVSVAKARVARRAARTRDDRALERAMDDIELAQESASEGERKTRERPHGGDAQPKSTAKRSQRVGETTGSPDRALAHQTERPATFRRCTWALRFSSTLRTTSTPTGKTTTYSGTRIGSRIHIHCRM